MSFSKSIDVLCFLWRGAPSAIRPICCSKNDFSASDIFRHFPAPWVVVVPMEEATEALTAGHHPRGLTSWNVSCWSCFLASFYSCIATYCNQSDMPSINWKGLYYISHFWFDCAEIHESGLCVWTIRTDVRLLLNFVLVAGWHSISLGLCPTKFPVK